MIAILCIMIGLYTEIQSSYQQTQSLSLSSGYQEKTQTLYQQQGVLSHGPNNAFYQLKCRNTHCQWKQLQLGIYPINYRVRLGYNILYETPSQTKHPFIGLSFQTPRNQETPMAGTIHPHIIFNASNPSEVVLDDPQQTFLLREVDSGIHTQDAKHLPQGDYPLTITTTDSQGQSKQQYQFISHNPIITQTSPPKLALHLGATKPKKSTHNSEKKHQLHASLAQNVPNRFGRSHHYVGLIEKQNILHLGHTFYPHPHLSLQPTITWIHHISQTEKNTTIGLKTLAQIQPGASYQLSMYTEKNSRSTTWHHQAQFEKGWLSAQSTWHWQKDRRKRYAHIHIARKKALKLGKWDLQLSLAMYQQHQAKPSFHARAQLTQKHIPFKPKIRLYTSNKQQNIRIQTSTHHLQQTQTTLKRFSQTKKPYYAIQASVKKSIESVTTKASLSHTFHPYHHKTQFSIQAKSGLSWSQGHLIWHPLPSPWQPTHFYIQPAQEKQWFWWGSHETIRNKGCQIRPVIAYKEHSIYPASTHTLRLYPGNVITHPMLTQ